MTQRLARKVMHRTIRARISSLLLVLLAVSAGTPLLDDARRFRSLHCETSADCAPAGAPRLELGGSAFAVAATGRTAVEQSETVRRANLHSITRDDLDAAPVRHPLDPVRVRAAASTRLAADAVIRVALQGTASSPVRGPPIRS